MDNVDRLQADISTPPCKQRIKDIHAVVFDDSLQWLITRKDQCLMLDAVGNQFFSAPPIQPEPQPTQPEGCGMLTNGFEIIKLQRFIYINIH